MTQNTVNIYANNWIIGSDQTNLFRANSSNLSIANGVSGTYTLTVNNGFNKATQASDWMVATVLVYSRELTTTELNTMELWLAQKYNLTSYLRLHQLNQITSGSATASISPDGLQINVPTSITGSLIVEFSGSLQDSARVYFGPVDIDRMAVKLLDDKGNVLNLNGNDWCFTLVCESLYQY